MTLHTRVNDVENVSAHTKRREACAVSRSTACVCVCGWRCTWTLTTSLPDFMFPLELLTQHAADNHYCARNIHRYRVWRGWVMCGLRIRITSSCNGEANIQTSAGGPTLETTNARVRYVASHTYGCSKYIDEDLASRQFSCACAFRPHTSRWCV